MTDIKEPLSDYIEGILLWNGDFYCSMCNQMTEGPAHPCAKPCEPLEAKPSFTVCGHKGCRLRPGHFPGHTDR